VLGVLGVASDGASSDAEHASDRVVQRGRVAFVRNVLAQELR
jgi:hypothetical protein|tara:strand:+ start:79 stop:204 length:126 start_codon:yes stop_codon:yes gene_type:complete